MASNRCSVDMSDKCNYKPSAKGKHQQANQHLFKTRDEQTCQESTTGEVDQLAVLPSFRIENVGVKRDQLRWSSRIVQDGRIWI